MGNIVKFYDPVSFHLRLSEFDDIKEFFSTLALTYNEKTSEFEVAKKNIEKQAIAILITYFPDYRAEISYSPEDIWVHLFKYKNNNLVLLPLAASYSFKFLSFLQVKSNLFRKITDNWEVTQWSDHEN